MLPLNNSKTIQLAHGLHSLLLSVHESNNPNFISFTSDVSNWDIITIYAHIFTHFFKKIPSSPNLHKSFHYGEAS
jgi:hypothetical protein